MSYRMAREILKCIICDAYTMKTEHCNEKTISIKPAKYSPEDKLGYYRRKYKKNELENSSNIKTKD
mgnify:CR=1 FL=1